MDYITRAEIQRMVDACDPTTLAGKRDRLLLVVLRALGGRSREVAALHMEDVVDNLGGWLVLQVGLRERIGIPPDEYTSDLPGELFMLWFTALDELSSVFTPTDPLFRAVTKDDRLSTRGHPCDGGRLTPWSINQIVKRAAAKAGLDNPERYTARIMRGPMRRKVKR
jgi:integrase